VKLSDADYALFDLKSTTSPVNLSYCFAPVNNKQFFMGNQPNDYGYFGFRV
jgi:hypothetical protein